MPIAPIKIDTFGGSTPAIDDRLLPNSSASQAVNTWLFSGRLEPLHSLVPIHTMNNQRALSFFRLPKIAPGIDYMSSSWWLELLDINVRVIRSPIAGQDDDGRYYWADGDYPKMMTGTMIKQQDPTYKGPWSSGVAYLENDQVDWAGVFYTAVISNMGNQPNLSTTYWVVTPEPLRLGVPAPETAPGVTVSGGVSATSKTVSYVYTWVTALGEEGPPSPPTTVTGKIDATYTIAMTAPTPTDKDHRNLTHTRIYRTVVGAQGVATFFFVVELPITTLTYPDNCAVTTDAVIVGNEQLTSLYWSAPPDDLLGLVTMPNGLIAGWRKNEVWFCEPYYPHAWPVPYVIAVDPDIVRPRCLRSVADHHSRRPALLRRPASDPSSMALPQDPAGCRALHVVACPSSNTPNGVLYSSPNGLINITPSGAANLTHQMTTKDQWNQLLHLNSVAAAILSQGYYAYSLGAPAVFQADSFQFFKAGGGIVGNPAADTPDAFQEQSEFGTMAGVYISISDPRIALSSLSPLPTTVNNVITDIFNGEIMVLRDGVVYAVDLRKLNPFAPFRWRSKIFTMPYLQNLGAAKVYWTPPYVPPPVPMTKFRMFAGDHAQSVSSGLPLRFEEILTEPGQILRLPSGYKALYYQFEVEGCAVIDAIHVAQTANELRAV